MKVFFSYGHDNHSIVVEKLAAEIRKQTNGEIDVWIDKRNIAEHSHWRKSITEGILSSDSVLAFLSKYSSREESVCLDEISIALASKHGMVRTILLESLKEFTPSSRVAEYQWGDMSNYREELDKGEAAFDKYIEAEAAKIIKMLTSDDIRQYDENITLLRSLLLPEMDFERLTKFDTMIENELIGRDWLFKKVNDWIDDPNGSNIMMIYGKPGAGKSMFSAQLQLRNSSVIAAFPCDYRYKEYSSTQSIIKNIAYRLALRLPDYLEWILKIVSKPDYDLNNDMLFNDLIIQPLSHLINGGRTTMVIVVDALDEMQNDELARFISENASSLRQYFRFLITSRKVPTVTRWFNNYKTIDLDEDVESTNRDLDCYFRLHLADVLPGGEESERFIGKLVANSGGVFAYAECVCKNIIDDHRSGRFSLGDYHLPNGLNALFYETVARSYNKDTFAQVKTPLAILLVSPEPVPVSSFKNMMNWIDEDVIDFCSKFYTFVININGNLQFFHKSFGEWLMSEQAGEFFISREYGLAQLADITYKKFSELELVPAGTSTKDESTGLFVPNTIKAAQDDEYLLLYTTYFLRESGRTEEFEEVRKSYLNGIRNKLSSYISEKRYDKAVRFCDEALELNEIRSFEDYYKTDNSLYKSFFYDLIIHHIETLETSGWLYFELKQFERSLQMYNKALELATEGLDKRKVIKTSEFEMYVVDRISRELSDILKAIAELYEKTGDKAKQKESLIKALEYEKELSFGYMKSYFERDDGTKQLMSVTRNKDAVRKHFETLRLLIVLCINEGDSEDTIKYARMIQDFIYYITVEEPDDHAEDEEFWIYRFFAPYVLGMEYFNRKEYDPAIENFLISLEIAKKYFGKDPEESAKYCGVSKYLFEIYCEREEYDNAINLLSEGVDFLEQWLGSYPDSEMLLRYKKDCLSDLSFAYSKKADHKGIVRCYEDVLKVLDKLTELSPQETELRIEYFSLLRFLTINNEILGDAQATKKYYHLFKEMLPEIMLLCRGDEDKRKSVMDILISFASSIQKYRMAKGIDDGKIETHNAEIKDILRILIECDPVHKIEYTELAYNRMELFVFHYKCTGEMDKLLIYYKERCALSGQLFEADKSSVIYGDMYYQDINTVQAIYKKLKGDDCDEVMQCNRELLPVIGELYKQLPSKSEYAQIYSYSYFIVGFTDNNEEYMRMGYEAACANQQYEACQSIKDLYEKIKKNNIVQGGAQKNAPVNTYSHVQPATEPESDDGDPLKAAAIALNNKNYEKAYQILSNLANKENPRAQGMLAIMYRDGLGMTPDRKGYEFWMYKAINNGDAYCAGELGKQYLNNGDGSFNPDSKESKKKYAEAFGLLESAIKAPLSMQTIDFLETYVSTVELKYNSRSQPQDNRLRKYIRKNHIEKAKEFCQLAADNAGDQYLSKQWLDRKNALMKKRPYDPAKGIGKRVRGLTVSKVFLLALILVLAGGVIYYSSQNKRSIFKHTKKPAAQTSTETVPAATTAPIPKEPEIELGDEKIELHDMPKKKVIGSKNVTAEPDSNTYELDGVLWRSAFVYRASDVSSEAYMDYDIGGRFSKLEFNMTPLLENDKFTEGAKVRVRVSDLTSGDVLYEKKLGAKAKVIPVSADVKGREKIRISVELIKNDSADCRGYTLIKDAYLCPEEPAGVSDSEPLYLCDIPEDHILEAKNVVAEKGTDSASHTVTFVASEYHFASAEYDIEGKFSEFRFTVAPLLKDDCFPEKAVARIRVFSDKEGLLYEERIKADTAAKEIKVDVTGANSVSITVQVLPVDANHYNGNLLLKDAVLLPAETESKTET